MASLVAEHSFRHAGFSGCGLQALECRLSSRGKDLVALRRVESFKTRDWQANSLTLDHQGCSSVIF